MLREAVEDLNPPAAPLVSSEGSSAPDEGAGWNSRRGTSEPQTEDLQALITDQLEAVKQVLYYSASGLLSELATLREENQALTARLPAVDGVGTSAHGVREVWSKPKPPPIENVQEPADALPSLPGGVDTIALPVERESIERGSIESIPSMVRPSEPRRAAAGLKDIDDSTNDPVNRLPHRHTTPDKPGMPEDQADTASECSGETGNRLPAACLPPERTLSAAASHLWNRRQDPARGPPQGTFADVEDMKRQVRAALASGLYDVKDYYKEEGYAQRVARSNIFEVVTLSIITFNALWIAVDVDLNKSENLVDADPIFLIAENFFCAYFLFELSVRFQAFKDKTNCMKDYWFLFDSALVAMMVFETWVLPLVVVGFGAGGGGMGGGAVLKLIRLVRLSRMARMARLLRALPELVILIKGMWVASRSVFFTLVLLVIIIYFFAIVFRQLTDGTEIGNQYYPSVLGSMSSLLLNYILPDQSVSITAHGDDHWGLSFLALLYMLLAGLTVMNMLVGVLVEVVSVVSSVEKEQLTVGYVKTRLDQIFKQIEAADTDGNRSISKLEFQQLLVKPEAARIIQEIGVDVYALVDISDFIFQDNKELKFPEFMELVLQLRGSNSATVKDIVDLRKFLSTELVAMEGRLRASEPSGNDSPRLYHQKTSQGKVGLLGVSSSSRHSLGLLGIQSAAIDEAMFESKGMGVPGRGPARRVATFSAEDRSLDRYR